MKKLLFFFGMFLFAVVVYAHCEIPCGIYDDPLRIKLLREHVDTVAKSIHEIQHLQAPDAKPDMNQLVRWVVNKETHATHIQEIVWQYFMTQRVKVLPPEDPGYAHYTAMLGALHRLTVEAMKAKQTVDPAVAAAMRKEIDLFEKLYFNR